MVHGVFKQHKVHGSDEIVVAGERLIEQLLELRPFVNREVLGISHALREVAVDEWLLEYYFFIVVLE